MDANQNINALEVSNSPAIWGLASIAVLLILVQTILFLRLALNASKQGKVKLTQQQCTKAIRSGVVTAIGPAFGVFIVMIGLIAVLGGPMAWLRLSVIGGASTELTAASVGVRMAGGDITQSLSMIQLSNAWWTMSINACGWLLVTWVFASRMEKMRHKIGGGDSRWMEVFSSAATLGIFGAFCTEYLVIAVQEIDWALFASVVASAGAMFVFMKIADTRYKWMREYCLGLAMIVGIISGLILS
ncbi:MAG: DUF5058 family protein [Bacillota bacterium]|nr:DUF5058 family protein [Bacillota bacterium]